MFSKLFIGVLIISAVIETKCDYRMPEYTRIKRAKYYSSPPQRLYRRPPFSLPISGPYSNTPPPGYMDEDEPPHLGSRPYKVSKQPTNEGLGEEDIYNMVKYLSKQDLEKIIEVALEKNKLTEKVRRPPERYSDNDMKHYREQPLEKHSSFDKNSRDEPKFSTTDNHQQNGYPEKIVTKREENVKIYRQEVKEIDDDRFPKNRPHDYRDEKPYDIEYANKGNNMRTPMDPRIIYATPEPVYHISNTQLDGAESSNPFNFVNTYIQNDLHENYPSNVVPNFNPAIESKINEADADLPRPVNLREEQDYEISFTHNVPTVAKAESYKIENFGSLPLMDYSSKLHSVSSYHVPRYTITSSKEPSDISAKTYGSPNIAPPIEPAPPASEARAQSDAHLKAIRIWTHKSRGTAYTLHNDGSLSLEKPSRPKSIYGNS